MSIFTRCASRQSEIPMSMQPPPCRPARLPQVEMPQFAGGEGSQDAGRHRVLAPARLVGQLPHVDEEEDITEGMNSRSYFTNLMSNGIFYPEGYTTAQPQLYAAAHPEVYATAQSEIYAADQPDDIPPPNEGAGQGQAQAVPKGHKKRSKNFSVLEDLLLVSAWLNVSLDPVQGVDQSRSTYWGRIYDYYHANKKFHSDRSQVSLVNCWSGIQHDVNVFVGCLSKIKARNQSGCSVDDKIASACAMFKADDRQHRNFPYMHCWKVLKDQPKWMERRRQNAIPKPVGKKQKTSANATPHQLLLFSMPVMLLPLNCQKVH